MKFMTGIFLFLFGFCSCGLLFSYSLASDVEIPLGFSGSGDVSVPSDVILEKDIVIRDDIVMIRVSNASLSRYAPSGSMRPVLDYGSNGLRIQPSSPDEVLVGDIITYERNDRLIVHRVVVKDIDAEGIYFITAGDNNNYLDERIRFNDIRYKTIAIFY